jgi:alkylated DNA repair dioxygenase AlkB
MITSPINPMRYWKLEEIQRMLNKIEGYENVVIEFQYTPSEGMGWHSDHYDCTCGIKEQLVNGQWNWLLKYKFQINDKNELGEARLAAFQEMAERLVTDVWRTSINSFRKQQRELNQNTMKNNKLEGWGDHVEEYATHQKQLHKELVDRKLMEMELKNTTTEKIDLTNIQTNNTNITWTENKLWTASSIFFITFLTLGWFYPMIVLAICLIALGALVLYLLTWLGTILLKEALELDDDE